MVVRLPFRVVAADSHRHSSPDINPFRRSHIFAVVGGMMVVSEDVAINGRASGSSWGPSRLSSVDETADPLRFPIRLLFAEHPIARFGQMLGHCADGLGVTLAPRNALVEAADVAVGRPPTREADRVRGFDERPLEVAQIRRWQGGPMYTAIVVALLAFILVTPVHAQVQVNIG